MLRVFLLVTLSHARTAILTTVPGFAHFFMGLDRYLVMRQRGSRIPVTNAR